LEGIYASSARTVKTLSEFLPSPLEPFSFHMERKCSLLASLVRTVFNPGVLSLSDVHTQVTETELSLPLREVCTDINSTLRI